MPDSDLPLRESARLVILNPRDECFLFHHQDQVPGDPANPVLRRYWVTPGGGVDPGETWEEAALRELWEETGIQGVPLGPLLWKREKIAPFMGEMIRQSERYYLVRVTSDDISVDNQLPYERDVYAQHRWWSLADLRATSDIVYPEGLATYLEPVMRGSLPTDAVTLTVTE